jgi:hypothetical protein
MAMQVFRSLRLEEMNKVTCDLSPNECKKTQKIKLDGRNMGFVYDGVGAVSAGASSRLLVDYPEEQKNHILNLLFKPKFGASSITAGRILLDSAVPVIKNTEGIPLVIENKLGKGKVIFVNIKAYPAEKCVRDLYENLLKQLGEEMLVLEKDKGWLKCSNEVEFTAFNHNAVENLRTIYFMNVNWWTDGSISSEAHLLWGEREIKLDVYRENINILNISDNWAIWTFDNETEIIDIREQSNGKHAEIRLQGLGSVSFILFNKELDNKNNVLKLMCSGEDVAAIPLDNCGYGWKINLHLYGVAQIKIEFIV